MATAHRENRDAAQFGELLEYSVVYTDRACNLMSSPYKKALNDLSASLKKVYNAKSTVFIPGSGTFAMEAAARQFGTDQKCLVIRNGFFSFRWTQIFEAGKIPSEEIVIKAKAVDDSATPSFAPPKIDEVVAAIKEHKPAAVFAPHVETSTGIILTDDYIRAVGAAAHEVGALFILDGIASGTVWVDMVDLNIDAFVSAPQKGWSGPACVGIVMLGEDARKRIDDLPQSTSFSCDLRKWLQVMEKYEAGGLMYHTSPPTDAILKFRDAVNETTDLGLEKMKAAAQELGKRVRAILEKNGFKSVAAEENKAPGVVVSYAPDAVMGGRFAEQGLQIAGGVPFKIDEPEGMFTFRIGLFGIDKLADVDGTVATFEKAIDAIVKKMNA
eukprot:TRINITY_DN1729_c0_g1_i1.p1 TRINITY_DN1729_c0_g1~~TRINITY_DN1729_c0_g1_i1.p1  ORF type:complete len:384 (+),score=123.86 TRINITY_DN1729_c0_g1_i1:1155-2306(+)